MSLNVDFFGSYFGDGGGLRVCHLNSASCYYKGSEDLIKGFHHLFGKQEQKLSLPSLTPSNWRTPKQSVGCDLQFAVSFTSGTVLLKPNTRDKQIVAAFDTDASQFCDCDF